MRIIIITLFTLLFTLTARTQPCWPDGFQLYSQFDVDNIAALSQGCSSVAGSVTITGPNITNLDSLSWITAIDGNLWIYMSPALTSLQGLSNLVSVSGTVNIFGNGSLENLTGLDNLQTIGGSLIITSDTALLNVDALGKLTSIGEDVVVAYNPALLNLGGLNNLTTIGRTLNIGENHSMVSLGGWNKLTTIGLDAYIASMDNLLNLDGINQLKTIGGTLHIQSCKQLSGIDGLQSLDTIGGALTLLGNAALTRFRSTGSPLHTGNNISIVLNPLLAEICPLRQPAVLSSLEINGTKLANLNFLQPVEVVENHLFVAYNDSLTDVSIFDPLERVGEALRIEGNKLENLNSFQNLGYVGGDLYINQYNDLTSLTGLENLDTVGGILSLNTLHFLRDVQGLSGLTWVGGNLSIAGVDTLENFQGLEQLRTIGGTLDLYSNPGLRDFSGLDSLTFVGRDFQIYTCPRLTSLNGLEKLDSVGGRFSVTYNALLSDCALEVLCRKLDLLPDSVFLENNAPGCNSTVEVGNACALPPGQCLFYGISFDKQAEVDRFPADHPGCTQIVGPVSVFGPDIKNLDSLRVLTAVGKQLNITSTQLATLGGLENLGWIGGSLIVSFNDSLRRLDQLEQLDSIGGSVSIYNNFALKKCTAEALCQYLEISPDSVIIQNNAPGCNNTTEVKIDCNLPPGQCLPEGITFVAQVNVDRFSLDYPGCTHIIGPVYVWGPDITTLDSLHVLTGLGADLSIGYTHLTSLSGLENITTLRNLSISYNGLLTGLTGLGDIDSAGLVTIENNAALTNLNGLEGFKSISDLTVYANTALTGMNALSHLTEIKGSLFVAYNDALTSLAGLEGITAIGGNAEISYNASLSALAALSNLGSVGRALVIQENTALPDFNGLDNLASIGNHLQIAGLPLIQNFAHFEKLTHVGTGLQITSNTALTDFTGLEQLAWANDSTDDKVIYIGDNPALTSLAALGNLAGPLHTLQLYENNALASLAGLENITAVTNIGIVNNPSLSDCAIFAVCNKIINEPDQAAISDNAPGCNTAAEVEAQCSSIPVVVDVLLDNNANCTADAADAPAPGVQVRLDGMLQRLLKPADSLGQARFAYLGSEPLTLDLPQFPAGHWDVCQNAVQLDPGGSSDTLRASLLLSPLSSCPELDVRLGMPSVFRGCLVSSDVQIVTQNTGAAPAENVKTAVVMPSVLELEASVPPLSGQNGDTLLFDLGKLQPFESGVVHLTVRTKCDTFLLGQTLCWEAFSAMDNACPVTLPAFSEIKLSAACVADTLVRFTIKNIGDAPTQGLHTYSVIRNGTVVQTGNFSLDNQQSMTVDLPVDSATYRMEATKFDDGTLTAVALENCGGLTPGWITAFWLEKGPIEYDFDCRQVIGSFDPNQKTAVPAGAEPNYTIVANQPLQYTIDFQNTGTDTAYRVLLRDVLPAGFDLNTFRSGLSSHPCTWEMRGNTLNVLFFPIALPDSNVNEPASRGFFSFELDQLPDLPDGTFFQNTASIIFDFNPPIVTNTVYHTIGKLTVDIDEPQRHADLWQVAGNPTRDEAIFSALTFIAGEKRFELYDASGRPVRMALFSGQSFVFQRDGLPGGVYFFRIGDEHGRWFTGKMVVTE